MLKKDFQHQVSDCSLSGFSSRLSECGLLLSCWNKHIWCVAVRVSGCRKPLFFTDPAFRIECEWFTKALSVYLWLIPCTFPFCSGLLLNWWDRVERHFSLLSIHNGADAVVTPHPDKYHNYHLCLSQLSRLSIDCRIHHTCRHRGASALHMHELDVSAFIVKSKRGLVQRSGCRTQLWASPC